MASYSRRNFIRQSAACAAGIAAGAASRDLHGEGLSPSSESGAAELSKEQTIVLNPKSIFQPRDSPSLSSTITIRWDTRAGCK